MDVRYSFRAAVLHFCVKLKFKRLSKKFSFGIVSLILNSAGGQKTNRLLRQPLETLIANFSENRYNNRIMYHIIVRLFFNRDGLELRALEHTGRGR